jgi:hypothetical protein
VYLFSVVLDIDAQDAKRNDEPTVLANLVKSDSVFESGITVSGTCQQKDRSLLRTVVNRHWKLTLSGDRIGYRKEVIDYEKPAYPEAKGGIEDAPTLTIRTRQWGYWGDDLSGEHNEDMRIDVSPDGTLTEGRRKMHNSMVFGPKSLGPIAPKQFILWSLGRFFSKHLDKVDKIENSTSGHLLVSASGRLRDGKLGRWELEIEPAAAWMVRKARFYEDRTPNRIGAEMKNEGTVWSGLHCIPKKAATNYWGSVEGVDTERITFEPVVETFDEALYAETQQAVAYNQNPALTIFDHRATPPVVTEPNRPKHIRPESPREIAEPSEPKPATPASGSARLRWSLVGSVLVLVAALITFRVFRNRQQGNTEKTP